MKTHKTIPALSYPDANNTVFAIRVECYAGYRGEETPRMIRFKKRVIRVEEVLDSWLAPNHRYFKVKGDDQFIYILRHDPQQDFWQLTYYTQLNVPRFE